MQSADVDIIAEMHAFTDTTSAIQFGRMIEELGIFYYERAGHAVKSRTDEAGCRWVNIPLAAGEFCVTGAGDTVLSGKRQP